MRSSSVVSAGLDHTESPEQVRGSWARKTRAWPSEDRWLGMRRRWRWRVCAYRCIHHLQSFVLQHMDEPRERGRERNEEEEEEEEEEMVYIK